MPAPSLKTISPPHKHPPRRRTSRSGYQPAKSNTFFRIYRAFLAARAALGLTLVGILVGATLFGSRPAWWMLALTLLYCVATLIWWALPSQRRLKNPAQHTLRTLQSLATIGLDLAAFALLHYLAGANFNSQALLILPVLMASVLLPG